MKKTFGNLKDNFLSRDQMKGIKGGKTDPTVNCVCCSGSNAGKSFSEKMGPDDDFDSLVEFGCGSSSNGCCECCGC